MFGIFGKRSNKFGREPIVLFGMIVHWICFLLIFLNLPDKSPIKAVTSADDYNIFSKPRWEKYFGIHMFIFMAFWGWLRNFLFPASWGFFWTCWFPQLQNRSHDWDSCSRLVYFCYREEEELAEEASQLYHANDSNANYFVRAENHAGKKLHRVLIC